MRKRKEIKQHDKSYENKGWSWTENFLKEFSYRIVFKDKSETNGTLTCRNFDEVADTFLGNKYTICNNDKEMFYYNSDEILYFEAKEERGCLANIEKLKGIQQNILCAEFSIKQ